MTTKYQIQWATDYGAGVNVWNPVSTFTTEVAALVEIKRLRKRFGTNSNTNHRLVEITETGSQT